MGLKNIEESVGTGALARSVPGSNNLDPGFALARSSTAFKGGNPGYLVPSSPIPKSGSVAPISPIGGSEGIDTTGGILCVDAAGEDMVPIVVVGGFNLLGSFECALARSLPP